MSSLVALRGTNREGLDFGGKSLGCGDVKGSRMGASEPPGSAKPAFAYDWQGAWRRRLGLPRALHAGIGWRRWSAAARPGEREGALRREGGKEGGEEGRRRGGGRQGEREGGKGEGEGGRGGTDSGRKGGEWSRCKGVQRGVGSCRLAYRADVGRVGVAQGLRNVPWGELQGAELVEAAEGRRGPPGVACQPRLHTVDFVVDLVDHL